MNTNYIEINGIPSRLIRGIPSAPGPEKTPSALTASILKVVDVHPDGTPAASRKTSGTSGTS